ncbi:MAG: hypothetical protein ACFNXV_04325, partial [Pauljensenia sp.]
MTVLELEDPVEVGAPEPTPVRAGLTPAPVVLDVGFAPPVACVPPALALPPLLRGARGPPLGAGAG